MPNKKKHRVHKALGGFVPFSRLSRHKQRDEYIKLRSDIERNKTRYGGDFKPNFVDEPGRPAFYDHVLQFQFLGRDGHTIWNCYLQSASHEYWGKISSLAHDEADRRTQKVDCTSFNVRDHFIPVYDSVTGKKLHYVMKEQKPQVELDNQTRHDFLETYAQELIKKDDGSLAPIHETFQINLQFEYGVGLYATLDTPFIDKAAILAMIAKFQALGEVDWKSPSPIPHDHLPKETFAQMLSKEYK